MNLKSKQAFVFFFLIISAVFSQDDQNNNSNQNNRPQIQGANYKYNFLFPEFFPYANGTYPNPQDWDYPEKKYNAISNTTWDPFNATVHRVNDTYAPYWQTPPYYYNGTHMFDGLVTLNCTQYRNGSNGTNCSFIYGGPYFRSFYNDRTPKCLPSVLKSYGLSGKPSSEPMEISICPNIKNSCCNPEDLFDAFKSWQNDGGQTNLENRFNFYINSYYEFLQTIGKASKLVGTISTRIKNLNNCQLLANTIKEFKIDDVGTGALDLIKNSFGFFNKTFQSFYCNICDAKSHQYFDLTRQNVRFSKYHCRDVITNTLPFLVYFHRHYTKLVNLIVDFTTNCDGEGQFKHMEINEAYFKMKIEFKKSRLLERCVENRNTLRWYKSCLPICKKFKLTQFDEFFLPNFEQLTTISSYINGNVAILERDYYQKLAEDELKYQKTANTRILTEQIKKKNKKLRKLQFERKDSFGNAGKGSGIDRRLALVGLDNNFIQGSIGQTVDFGKMVPVYQNTGLRVNDIVAILKWNSDNYDRDFEEYSQLMKFNQTASFVHVVNMNITTNSSGWGIFGNVADYLKNLFN